MGILSQINHLLNFAMPALGLALFMLLFSWLRHRKKPLALALWQQFLAYCGVGLLVLVAGLWFFGRDGMMATYGLLVTAVATSQWVIEKGWQR